MATVASQGFMLTYQEALPLNSFKNLEVFDLVREWSWCIENANRRHTHVYFVLEKKPQHIDVEAFEVEGNKPHIDACSARGRSSRRAWDRGHFYVYNPFKNTHVESLANYMPMRDYAVDGVWIMTLWRQGKLDDPVHAATKYRCLTPHMEAQVNIVAKKTSMYERKNYLESRSTALAKKMVAYNHLPEVLEWYESYREVKHRYHFLWMSGPSGMGKTMYAMNVGMDPFLHSAGVNWGEYDPQKHDVIVFDDIYDMETYINMHKPIFQAARLTAVNTSKTNMFAQMVDTAGKKIIVCSNDAPTTTWVTHNCVHVHVTEKLYVQRVPICNYGEYDDE